MPRRRITFVKAGGSAKAGEIVTAFGKSYFAKRDTDTSPPGPDWQPTIVETEAFAFAGPPGRDGVDGKAGRDGRDGVIGKDGQGFTPRGQWKRFNTYEPGDVVTHEGSSYLAKVESIRREPPNPAWQLLAAAGERGLRGERGEQGGAGQRGRSVLVETDGNTAKAWFDSAAVRGNPVYASSAGHVGLAVGAPDPTDVGVWNVIGLATATTPEGGHGEYVTNGPFKCDSWNFEPNKMVYLSTTVPGGLTQTYPDEPGTFVVLIGMAVTPTAIILNVHYMLEN